MRQALLLSAVSAGALVLASGAAAQTSDTPDLARIVQDQAAAIAVLEARLAVLEARTPASPAPASPAARVSGPVQAAPEPAISATASPRPEPQLRVDWSKGAPEFSDAGGRFTFKPRGRLVLDASATEGSDFANRNTGGTELRAARLGVEGSLDRSIGYVVEVDYTDNAVSLRSVNLEFGRELAGLDASLTVGQRLNDRSLDGSSGIVSVPFVERNAVGQALGPQRGSYGVGLTGRLTGETWHLTAAVTGEDANNTGDGDDIVTWGTRAHWNPVRTDALTLHLGGWAIHEDFPETLTAISRNTYVAGHFNDLVRVPSGSLAQPESALAYGLEAGAFGRSAWIYGEAGTRTVEGGPATASYSVDQDAWSLAAGWFLTGERPGYQAKSGTWSRTRVLAPVTDGGRGAWELAARYDDYDFRDAPTGGAATALTLGVNWYWTSQLRFMLNAVAWETDHRVGAFQGVDTGRTFVLRSQLVF